MKNFETKEIQAKSILSPSKLKDADYDYSCNPYIGCRFGCVYCYASFMARMIGKSTKDWGNFVYAKVNAPELLKKEVSKLKNHGQGKVIWFSSVTDPYQGLEKKYRLTRKCLEALIEMGFKGQVSILTKSNLVEEDIEVFKKLNDVEVGITITSTDDNISRYFEKFAPSSSMRFDALKKLNQDNIPTYVFIGPLLPHFALEPDKLDKLFKEIHDAGTTEIYVEYLNLSPYILNRLKNELKDINKQTLAQFYDSQRKDYRKEIDKLIFSLVKKYDFHLRLGGTLYHKEMS